MMRLPSGLKATAVKSYSLSFSTIRSCLPLPTSQRRNVSSPLPDTMRLPSALKAMEVMLSLWPRNVLTSLPSQAVQILMAPSQPPAAR